MMKLRKRRCGLARGAGEKRTIYERGQGQVDGESTRTIFFWGGESLDQNDIE